MTLEENSTGRVSKNYHAMAHNNAGGAVYGLGLIGAAVYFIGHAVTFWAGVLGFLKAIIWPAILVFKALEYLKL
ncbi:MAG: hypothetical protein WC865_10130 [Bacteroidales bacterium]